MIDAVRSGLLGKIEQLARELDAAEIHFRDVIRDCADGLVLVDDTGFIVYANPAAERMFGRNLLDLIGEPFPVSLGPGERDRLDVIDGAGRHLVAEMRVAPTSWEGEPVRLVSLCDVTTAVEASEARQLDAERYARAVEGLGDGLFDWDLLADEVYYSGRWTEMLGLERFGPSARLDDWLEMVHPDDLPGLKDAIRLHLDGGSEHLEHRYRIRHADGAWRPMRVRGVVDRDVVGTPIRLTGFQAFTPSA